MMGFKKLINFFKEESFFTKKGIIEIILVLIFFIFITQIFPVKIASWRSGFYYFESISFAILLVGLLVISYLKYSYRTNLKISRSDFHKLIQKKIQNKRFYNIFGLLFLVLLILFLILPIPTVITAIKLFYGGAGGHKSYFIIVPLIGILLLYLCCLYYIVKKGFDLFNYP